MAGTVHDLLKAAGTAAANAQKVVEAGRDVAAQIAASRPAAPPAPASEAPAEPAPPAGP